MTDSPSGRKRSYPDSSHAHDRDNKRAREELQPRDWRDVHLKPQANGRRDSGGGSHRHASSKDRDRDGRRDREKDDKDKERRTHDRDRRDDRYRDRDRDRRSSRERRRDDSKARGSQPRSHSNAPALRSAPDEEKEEGE